MIQIIAALAVLGFSVPIFMGLAGVILPAFSFFPALGYDEFQLSAITSFLSEPQALPALISSLLIGMVATLLSVVAVFIILAIGFQQSRNSIIMRWFRALSGPLIALPHSTVAIAILFLLAPSGWLVRLISPEITGWLRPPAFGIVPDQSGAVLIAGLMMKEIPFLLFITLAQSRRFAIDDTLKLGASLGYQPVSIWLYLIWPQLYKLIRLPLFAVLAFALSVVDMTLILGPTLPPPLAILILQGFEDPDLARRLTASAAALCQCVIIIVAICLWFGIEKLAGSVIKTARNSGMRLGLLHPLCLVPFYGLAVKFVALLLGLFAIFLWACSRHWRFPDALPAQFSLYHWRSDAAFGAVFWDSLIIAISASLLALCICVLWLERKSLSKRQMTHITSLLFIPLFIPQISLLFGLQVGLSYAYLDGRFGTVIWLHVIYILPYSWLVMAPAYRNFDGRYLLLARTLGKRNLHCFFTVRLPMLAYSFASAFLIGVAVSVALYLPSLFAGAGRINTITIEAVTQAASGARGPAAIAAMMQICLPLMLFCLVKLLLFLRFRRFRQMQNVSA